METKLIDQFTKNKRSYKVVDFPRKGEDGKPICQVCVRTLLQSEMDQIDDAVNQEMDIAFKEHAKLFSENSAITLQRYQEKVSHVKASHILSKIITDPIKKDFPVFVDPNTVGNFISLDEAEMLVLEYYKLRNERMNTEELTNDTFHQWVEKLADSAEGDLASFLEQHYSGTLIKFTTFMVNLCSTLKSQNSLLSTELQKYISDNSNDSTPPSSPSTVKGN